jgi:DNA topoisomerase-3
MKRFADSIARQKRIKPPAGYTKSGFICRAFLAQHASKKTDGETAGEQGPKLASRAQIMFAEKIAQEKGVVIPDEAKASSAAISAWIGSNESTKLGKGRRNTVGKPSKTAVPKSTAPKKRSRKPAAEFTTSATAASPTSSRRNSRSNTPLRIPYGNKEIAEKLGARYGAGGWYAPPGVDLAAFREQGWL